MSATLSPKTSNRWIMGLVIATTAIIGGTVFYSISQFGQVSQSSSSKVLKTTPSVKKITALGRLEPEAEVMNLSVPVALDGDRISQLLVKESDIVKAGQVVAILESHARLQDALLLAEKQVKVSQAKLAQVKAGAKTGEIQAQQAVITRLQVELAGKVAAQNAAISRWQSEVRKAHAEYDRYRRLYQMGVISISNLDSQRLNAETAQAQLNEAKALQNQTIGVLKAELSAARATLSRIAEVRPVDVQAAQTEVETAQAAVKRAQTYLKQAYIRAPIAGQILKIHTQTGEKVGSAGILELAQNNQMVAVAEIYQTDIGKVQVGQPAIITSQAFSKEVRGVVSQIGLQVNRQNVFSTQPGENFDRRIVEVKIRLNREDSKRVAGLTNLQVQTTLTH
ncbi:ABC exporter membrane fusion protein [Scytonema sp. NUACC21]